MYSSIGSVESTDLSAKTLRAIRKFLAESFSIPIREIPRVLFHGLILAFIIAGFWLLDSLKDPVLGNLVGLEYQPVAKLLSVVFVLVVVCIYDYLTSIVTKADLFHIVANVFGLVFLIFAALLSNKKSGLDNHVKSPDRYLGWFVYFTIEAYGSLSVALFWSFTNSIMDLEQAKGAYGLIIAIAQVGAVLGSTLATNAAEIGIPRLFIFGSMLVFPVSMLIKVYNLRFPDQYSLAMRNRVRTDSESSTHSPLISDDHADDMSISSSHHDNGNHSFRPSSPMYSLPDDTSDSNFEIITFDEKPEAVAQDFVTYIGTNVVRVFHGFIEGLSLIFKYPYVMKLLGVCCIYEIVVVILDYEFKLMGSHAAIVKATAVAGASADSTGDGDASNQFANLLGHFGQLTNLIAFLLSLFGFSYLVHHIGVKHSLMIFPTVLFISVVVSYLVPSLWVLFVCVSIIKAMLFSLHDPVKEILYIPTSESIKFKAKAWIDVFGSRFAKACGSLITTFAFGNIHTLRNIGEIPALVCSLLVLALTWSIGQDFIELVASNTVVGDVLAKIHHDESEGPVINGLRPGDVGYSGYDLRHFEGVFEDEVDANSTYRSKDTSPIQIDRKHLPHAHQPHYALHLPHHSQPSSPSESAVAASSAVEMSSHIASWK